MPVYASLALMTKKIVFEEIDVPRYIKALFIYWYAITYIASLFFFQETSVWLFIRFIMMSYFPLCIVVGYYYSNFKMTREKRILMLLQSFLSVINFSMPSIRGWYGKGTSFSDMFR